MKDTRETTPPDTIEENGEKYVRVVMPKPLPKGEQDLWDELLRTQRSIRILDADLTKIYLWFVFFAVVLVLSISFGGDDGRQS